MDNVKAFENIIGKKQSNAFEEFGECQAKQINTNPKRELLISMQTTSNCCKNLLI